MMVSSSSALRPSSHTWLLAIVLLAQTVLVKGYNQAFVGCYNQSIVPATQDQMAAPDMTIDECALNCYTKYGTLYGYLYSEMYLGLTLSFCVCSDTAPDVSEIETATGDQTCGIGETGVAISDTTYEFDGCVSELVTIPSDSQVASIEACLVLCNSDDYTYVAATPSNSGDSWECACSNTIFWDAADDAETCTATSYYTYDDSASTASAPSQYNKRQSHLKERLQRRSRARPARAFCPEGLTACNVEGTSGDAFECVDTMTELESCGGCTRGVFGVSAANSTGVDCSSLPGSVLGGVTCSAGDCVAYACEPEYTMSAGGRCIEA